MVVHGADWFLPRGRALLHAARSGVHAGVHAAVPAQGRRGDLRVAAHDRRFRADLSACRDKVATVYFGPAQHFRREADPARLARCAREYALPERFILTLRSPLATRARICVESSSAYQRMHGAMPHKLVVGGLGCERFREGLCACPPTAGGAT